MCSVAESPEELFCMKQAVGTSRYLSPSKRTDRGDHSAQSNKEIRRSHSITQHYSIGRDNLDPSEVRGFRSSRTWYMAMQRTVSQFCPEATHSALDGFFSH